MDQFADAVVFVAASGAVVLTLILVGYGPVRAVLPSYDLHVIGLAGCAGCAVLVAITGVTAVYVSRPAGSLIMGEVAALAVLGAIVMVRDARRERAPFRRETVATIGVAVVAVLVSAWSIRWLFGFGPLATAAWNNDVLSYAFNARLIEEMGLGSEGWIIGFDAGGAARSDVLGAYTALVPFGLLFGDSLHATMPVMAGVTAVTTSGSYGILRRLFRASRGVAAIGCLVFFVSFPATYNSYQYFFSERLAIAIILASVALSALSRSTWHLIAIQGVATSGLLLAYPQAVPVSFAMTTFGVVAGLGLRWPGSIRHRLTRSVAVAGGTCAGAIVLTSYLLDRLERARGLLSVNAGWSMPTLSLAEAVGAVDPLSFLTSTEALVIESAVAVAVLLLMIGFGDRSVRSVALACLTLLLPMGVYIRFAIAEPDSYRQWKAMALAAPFAVLAMVGLALLLIRLTRLYRLRIHTIAVVPLLVVGVMFVMSNHGGYYSGNDPNRCLSTECPIGTDVRERLGAYAATADSKPVGVALGVFWPSMAGAYFLWGRPIAMRDLNYWAVSDAPVGQTLGPNGWYDTP